MTGRTSRSRTFSASVAVLALALILGTAQTAAAEEYPSWSDVESARGNEAAAQAKIVQIQALIDGITAEVGAAQDLATLRAAEYETAQTAFDEGTYRAASLQAQADAASQQAAASATQAGRLAVSLSRTGASDLSLSLILEGDNAADLLGKLSSMSKLSERTNQIYDNATRDRNASTAVTAQAVIARDALSDLAIEAETALTEATAAAAALTASLAQQQQNAATLAAQLSVLTEDRAATEADYAKGEAARRAAEAAAAAAGAAGPSLDSGQLSDQGWALPVAGWISDRFGPRPEKPVAGVSDFHSGTDLAAGCGRGVYAATGGTVIYAGWLGSYGNWVLIDHGNGVQTGYAHNSTVLVREGQTVAAGANISLVGTTGASSGCHLHFEVRVDGARIDPQPFMSARGVQLG